MAIYLIFIIICLNLSSSMLVLPFKTAYINKNGNIDKNSKEYNSTHFMNDYFETLLYTSIKIGNPPQEVKVLLTYQDCGFKIGKANKCLLQDEYLSHYYRNNSLDFNYTDVYTVHIRPEFDLDSCSAKDSIYFYKDLNLKKYEKFENVDFYLGSDTNDPLCGVIGFKMNCYEPYCSNISLIQNAKSKDIINTYNWALKYKSNDEGYLVIGCKMNDIIPNYNEKYQFGIYTRFIGRTYPWSFNIDELIIGDRDEVFTGEQWIEIDNDISFLIGNNKYENYIKENFFKEFFYKEICSENEWQGHFRGYKMIECDKEKFGKKEINKFPSVSFINRTLATEIRFENKELFTETKYKYFFNVIFPVYNSGIWYFGKLFLKKYPVMINLDQNYISLYNDKNTNDEENPKKMSGTKIFLFSFGIFGLLCITGILCYLLGKNLNKARKKKANELNDDEYDYSSQVNNNEDINRNS